MINIANYDCVRQYYYNVMLQKAIKAYINILTWIRVYSCAVKEHCGSSIAERSIDHVTVASNPTNVSVTGVDVTRLVVKVILNNIAVEMFVWVQSHSLIYIKRKDMITNIILYC